MDLLAVACLSLAGCLVSYMLRWVLEWRSQRCYMLHYECYKGRDEMKLNTGKCAEVVQRNKNLGLEEYRFLLRTMVSSGIGEETYGPRNVLEGREENPTLPDALSEMDDIIFSTTDNLFRRTGVSPSEIDILVLNVSLFAPAPSLASRVINRYKMRDDIKCYNLSGLGCSASVISIDLVQRLFKTCKNSLALVVSTETMGPHWYCGKNRSMMLSNCLFRAGGSSVLLTNDPRRKNKAIMRLKTVVRAHVGSDDDAYSCCIQMEDKEGYQGFLLTKYLKNAAAKALTKNLQVLLPKVLPMKELLRYAIVRSLKKKTKGESSGGGIGLNLKTGLQHFCIHPGGRAIIEGAGKSLGLNEYDIEPSRNALHRFGNTSSGGLWYVLGYMEAKKRLRKGDKLLMISMGAGFESNNCVWDIMKDLDDENVWTDSIQRYPEAAKVPNPFKEKFDWINDETLSSVRIA
ncbi:PREDICTED: 3-ketoacyl-CoA synthase 19-like [Tarenaya hassleriana]|uniref:3-ketoacyl-CoA synthase 19-like n=1 Tax=Tarenaya hassleriana TaxID=28532 RepID=UPI00053C71C0|nr:PREDICTED: 3-ketoacyl-CoA synthase 19-like [Tarenaya hassleriana]XP_010520161.1 PREDICTED: 3-ketoacyl-CoA synthase 19-like [Tarenaya hassleriana]XP_010520162.1 PREDICTED: 3-ketoacyl-CoA synthase 19-like [Tarenaya hassleriana]XP_010520163.1 PREDICTED: 3-ketoacyl-CoA synthase 19-like [Tarenaya hassleriana]